MFFPNAVWGPLQNFLPNGHLHGSPPFSATFSLYPFPSSHPGASWSCTPGQQFTLKSFSLGFFGNFPKPRQFGYTLAHPLASQWFSNGWMVRRDPPGVPITHGKTSSALLTPSPHFSCWTQTLRRGAHFCRAGSPPQGGGLEVAFSKMLLRWKKSSCRCSHVNLSGKRFGQKHILLFLLSET